MTIVLTTRYFGPTDTIGSRIRVSIGTKKRYISWDYALNLEENHRAAAMAVLEEFHPGTWEVNQASLPTTNHEAYVFIATR